LWLTQSGARQVDVLSSMLVGWLVERLEQSQAFDGRPDREQVEAALDRVAQRVLMQRDWEEDRPRLAAAGQSSI
jgi:hypothetical protein